MITQKALKIIRKKWLCKYVELVLSINNVFSFDIDIIVNLYCQETKKKDCRIKA